MEKSAINQIIHREVEKLTQLTSDYILEDVRSDKMEMGLLKELLQICYVLLNLIFQEKIKQKKSKRPVVETDEVVKHKGEQSRKYQSLFGEHELIRPSYWTKTTGKVYVLDEDLNLPKANWSYNLQELIGLNASENDFRESVRVVNKLLNLGLSGKSSERNSGNIGPQVEVYYTTKSVEVRTDAVCFSATFDGKGVPKIKDKQEPTGNPKARLGKGEKTGTMQMATVGVMSCFIPKQRSATTIINTLMGSPLSVVPKDEQAKKEHLSNDNKWHQDIHRRSFLDNQAKSIDYGIKHVKDRMKHPDSRFVVPLDGGIGLEDKVLAAVTKYGLDAQFDGIIMDIIHVSEYVWKAGTAIFGEKSKSRAPWVRHALEDILASKTEGLIKDLELIVEKTELSDNKVKQINKTINYFKNHQHKMDYKTFIAKGYPVSSALVESACGHLVKERMEQSGMRWSSQGAQNIMDLRAVKLNEDMDDFMQFVINKDRIRKNGMAA